LAQSLFWVHMGQHVLLLTVAPPLIVLGAPWMSIWRPLPLGFRRAAARSVLRSPGFEWLRAIGRWLGSPLGAWLAFSVNLLAWHIPAAYDAALSSVAVHALEHVLYLSTGILLWLQVLDSPPLHAHLRIEYRAYYFVAAMAVGWVLSLVLAFAPDALYPIYAHLANRPGGISALTDQQLAAGMMLVPGSITMLIFVFVQLYQWLGAPADAQHNRQQTSPLAGA
jgi:putative membrane protein